MTERDQLLDKIGQLYQVLGGCWGGVIPTEAEWQRALDYAADEDAYDPDFLPWPREVANRGS